MGRKRAASSEEEAEFGSESEDDGSDFEEPVKPAKASKPKATAAKPRAKPTPKKPSTAKKLSTKRAAAPTGASDDVLDLTADGSGETPAASQVNGSPAAEATATPAVKARKPKATLASSMPLLIPRAASSTTRTTALVQVDDPSFDLSGDVGAIGRLTVLPSEGMILDLKGHRYAGHIVPTVTCMVVGMAGAEAKVESVVSDFILTEHVANVIDALSGVLTSGSVDATLLQFEDVDGEGDVTAVLRAREGKGGDAELEEAPVKGKKKRVKEGDAEGAVAGAKRSRAASVPKAHAGTRVRGVRGAKKVKAAPRKKAAVKGRAEKAPVVRGRKGANLKGEAGAKPPPKKRAKRVAKRDEEEEDEEESNEDDADEGEEGEGDVPAARRSSLPRGKKATVSYADSGDDDDDGDADDHDDDDDEDEDAAPPAKKAPQRRPAKKPEAIRIDDEDDDVPPPVRSSSKAAAPAVTSRAKPSSAATKSTSDGFDFDVED